MSIEKPKKSGAPPVGLYLRLGPDWVDEQVLRELKQIFFVINGSDYERNMHALEIFGDGKSKRFQKKAAEVIELTKANGIATLYRGDAKHAQAMGAEGVVLEDPEAIKKARDLLGEEALIGFACGNSEELAARAHDEGVDFVTLGSDPSTIPNPKLLHFWTLLSENPAVIESQLTNDDAKFWVEVGAGFLNASHYIWSHKEGVMQGTVNMLYAIDLALESQGEEKT